MLTSCGVFRKDKYNKKLKRYKVVVDEVEDDYAHDEEKEQEVENREVAWLALTLMPPTLSKHLEP